MRTEFENWYICVNGKVDLALQDDKSQAYEIYNWMLTDEGRKESELSKEDEITIHGGYFVGRELEQRLKQQKAWSEMLKNGLAEKS